MTRTVIIEPEAHEDLSRAFAWYEETNPGMGQVFIDVMREAVSRLTTTPDGSTTIPTAPTSHVVHRVFARRFPYADHLRGDLRGEGGRGLRRCLRAHEAATRLLAREVATVGLYRAQRPYTD